jgi:immune inhibitor A
MSALNHRRLAGVAVTTVLVAGLTSGLTTLLPAEAAAPSAPAPAPSGTRSTGDADGLTIENSFVSSQGWVKPGDNYPSRILLGNETGSTISGATVTITAPRGTTFLDAGGPGDHPVTADQIVWTPGDIAPDARPTLVLESKAASTTEEPTIVWRDLSTRAVLDTSAARSTVFSHGPKVIPPGEAYETAKYGDRPFPVVPIQYTDRDYQPTNSGAELEGVINDPRNPGSTFNLFQEMSLGQLYPQASVGSAGLDGVGFDYEPGFDFTNAQVGQTCTGATLEDAPVDAEETPAYPTRISNGVYNLPGDTAYYGSDANGSALVGALAGVGALQ